VLDGDVVDEILRGNAEMASKLKDRASTCDVYISSQGYKEVVTDQQDLQLQAATQLILQGLGIRIAPVGGTRETRVEDYFRNLTVRKGPLPKEPGARRLVGAGDPEMQEQDVLTAVQAKSINAEIWSADKYYRNNWRSAEKTFGVRVAPESYQTPLRHGAPHDYQSGLQALGINAQITAAGIVTRGGPGKPPTGGGGTPPTGGVPPPPPPGPEGAPRAGSGAEGRSASARRGAPAAQGTDRATTEAGTGKTARMTEDRLEGAPRPPRVPPRPPSGGSLKGIELAGAAFAVFVAVAQAMTEIGNWMQEHDAEVAVRDEARRIGAFLDAYPDQGALVVLEWTEQLGGPMLAPGNPARTFRGVTSFNGRTEQEALATAANALKWQFPSGAPDLVRTFHTKIWIAPTKPTSGKRRPDPNERPATTKALVREVSVDLKIGNYVGAFHELNGSSMKQMLQALNELKRTAQLDALTANFDKAQGVNRPRVWVALRATFFRGSTDSYRMFMADDALIQDLQSVEAEGQAAVRRVLLQNRDD
jgi:hypothetical protein